jgi:hypothetical protein
MPFSQRCLGRKQLIRAPAKTDRAMRVFVTPRMGSAEMEISE